VPNDVRRITSHLKEDTTAGELNGNSELHHLGMIRKFSHKFSQQSFFILGLTYHRSSAR